MSKACYKGILLDGRTVEIEVNKDRIATVTAIANDPDLPHLLPVLTDLQQNGALGTAYVENLIPGKLRKVANHLLDCGVGRVLATFPTAPFPTMMAAAKVFRTELEADPALERMFFGVFHEGVFISPVAGWRGGHNPALIAPPNWERFVRLNALTGNRVKMVNVAPEIPGAMDFISRAAKAGIIPAIGHCNPTAEQITEAVQHGVRAVTHFGNGAAPLIHRFHNPFWAMLTTPGLHLGLIGDGFHLPPELVKTALKMQPCYMVSDACAWAGCPPGTYHREAGLKTIVESNGFIHLEDKEILGGAWFELNKGVEFLVNRIGLPFEQAWKLCSTIPAEFIGENLPQLRPGEEATFVVAHFQNGHLDIEQTVFMGKTRIKQKEKRHVS